MYSDHTEMLIDCLIDGLIGKNKNDHGIGEDQVEYLVEGIREAGIEADGLREYIERVALLLIERKTEEEFEQLWLAPENGE